MAFNHNMEFRGRNDIDAVRSAILATAWLLVYFIDHETIRHANIKGLTVSRL